MTNDKQAMPIINSSIWHIGSIDNAECVRINNQRAMLGTWKRKRKQQRLQEYIAANQPDKTHLVIDDKIIMVSVLLIAVIARFL